MSFQFKEGYLYCEELPIKTICEQVSRTPFYLYSGQEIRKSFADYKNALAELPAVISYAVKANGNLHILSLLRKLGCWATLVSGGEIHLALAAGFEPHQMIFNGNGKTIPELTLAIEIGSLINIDSAFDLDHIHQISERAGKSVNVLLRINPDIDPDVHPYISTGLQSSKFGLSPKRIPSILARLKEIPNLNLVGAHCHLGSTITNLAVFRQSMEVMANQFRAIRKQGFAVKYLNLGGGLGIDYLGKGEGFPMPGDLVAVIQDLVPESATLILEPGRSLIGRAGALICSVIGIKHGEAKNFIVTDGSMTELLRPSLYDAYHRIKFVEPVNGINKTFDIVGPVCESTDFLGKDRELPEPLEGTGMVVFDAGAYGYVMSSNYNARLRPPEYLVEGDQLILIRNAERLDDQLRLFEGIGNQPRLGTSSKQPNKK